MLDKYLIFIGLTLLICSTVSKKPRINLEKFRPGSIDEKNPSLNDQVTTKPSNTTTDYEMVDVNYYYRLFNEYSGKTKALELIFDQNTYRLKMSPINGKYSQQFYFVSLIGGYMAIRNRKLGDEFSLDVHVDQMLIEVIMTIESENRGQMWKLIPSEYGAYRIFNSVTDNEACLDIYSDSEVTHLSPASTIRSGHLWKLQKLGLVEKF